MKHFITLLFLFCFLPPSFGGDDTAVQKRKDADYLKTPTEGLCFDPERERHLESAPGKGLVDSEAILEGKFVNCSDSLKDAPEGSTFEIIHFHSRKKFCFKIRDWETSINSRNGLVQLFARVSDCGVSI